MSLKTCILIFLLNHPFKAMDLVIACAMANPTPIHGDMLIFYTTLRHDKMPKALVRAPLFPSLSPLFFSPLMLYTSGPLNNYCPHYPNMEVLSVSHN